MRGALVRTGDWMDLKRVSKFIYLVLILCGTPDLLEDLMHILVLQQPGEILSQSTEELDQSQDLTVQDLQILLRQRRGVIVLVAALVQGSQLLIDLCLKVFAGLQDVTIHSHS
jgi:hypothetical protein